MSEKPEDKNLYNMLRDSIDNMETEPSDHFWNKAYDSLLQKGNPIVYSKNISNWKNATMMLALAVVGLIGYSIYANRKVSDVEQRIAKIEQQQLQSESKQPGAANLIASSSNATSPINTGLQNNPNNTIIAGQNNARIKTGLVLATTASSSRTRSFSKKINYPTAEKQLALAQKELPPLPEVESKADTMNVPPVRELAHVVTERNMKSRISLSASLANSLDMPMIKENSQSAGLTINTLKENEHQQIAYSFGVNMGYDISPKWTVQLGFIYQESAFSIDATTLNPVIGEQGPYYSLVTSSGNISIPTISGGQASTGTATGGVGLSSLYIPLRLKYNFYSNSKLRLYACAGGSANILVSSYASVSLQSQSNEEDITTKDIDGSKELSLSCLIGMGVEYKLGMGLSAYAEPSYQQAFTPSSSTTSLSEYPAYFNATVGLSYHF